MALDYDVALIGAGAAGYRSGSKTDERRTFRSLFSKPAIALVGAHGRSACAECRCISVVAGSIPAKRNPFSQLGRERIFHRTHDIRLAEPMARTWLLQAERSAARSGGKRFNDDQTRSP